MIYYEDFIFRFDCFRTFALLSLKFGPNSQQGAPTGTCAWAGYGLEVI